MKNTVFNNIEEFKRVKKLSVAEKEKYAKKNKISLRTLYRYLQYDYWKDFSKLKNFDKFMLLKELQILNIFERADFLKYLKEKNVKEKDLYNFSKESKIKIKPLNESKMDYFKEDLIELFNKYIS